MSVKIIVKIKGKKGASYYINRKNWFPTKAEHDSAVWFCTAIRDILIAAKEKSTK